MEYEAWHVWWLVDGTDFIHLHEVHKEPKSDLLVRMVHERGHDKVHALHVADRVIIITKRRQNSFQSIIVWVLIQICR